MSTTDTTDAARTGARTGATQSAEQAIEQAADAERHEAEAVERTGSGPSP